MGSTDTFTTFFLDYVKFESITILQRSPNYPITILK